MSNSIAYELARVRLSDGLETTVYVVRHPLAATSLRVACFAKAQHLDRWCAQHEQPEAMVGGFFVRDPWRPLGELRVGGEPVAHEPVAGPWPRNAAACTSTAHPASRGAASSATSRPATSCRPDRCWCRTGGR